MDDALSILPNLKVGLDVNVKFDSIHGFEPTKELAMFDLFNVDLVHGWIADPQVRENKIGGKTEYKITFFFFALLGCGNI